MVATSRYTIGLRRSENAEVPSNLHTDSSDAAQPPADLGELISVWRRLPKETKLFVLTVIEATRGCDPE